MAISLTALSYSNGDFQDFLCVVCLFLYMSLKFYNTYYGLHYLQELLYNATGTKTPGEQEAVYPKGINIDKRKKTT